MELQLFDFNGPDYIPKYDQIRLSKQTKVIFDVMKDGVFRTLSEISILTNYPQASISAQLRHLRKPRFGAHTINKKHVGDRTNGLFKYQLVINN